jgi:hypothetical protein
MTLFEFAIDQFKSLPAVVLALALLWGLIRYIYNGFELPDSLATRQMWLEKFSFGLAYKYMLNAALDWLSEVIGDDDQWRAQPIKQSLPSRAFGWNPWTARSYSLCLLFAIFYPLAALIGFWLVLGGDGALGGWVLLHEAEWPARLMAIIFLATFGLAHWLNIADRFWGYKSWWTTFFVVALIIAAVATLIAGGSLDAIGLAVILIFVARAARIGGGIGAVGFSVGFAIIAEADSVHTGLLGTSFAIFWISIGFLWGHAARLLGFLGRFEAISWVVLTGSVFFAIRFIPGLGDMRNPVDTSVLLFFALLPLLNAPLDWLSLGVSRGLLGAIASGLHGGLRAVAWAVADLVLSLVFFVLVSGVTVAGTALANRMAVLGGGEPIVDLGTLLLGIRLAPGSPEYWWIYAMLLTTVVPTLIHLIIAGIAGMLWLGHVPFFETWRHRLAKQVVNDTDARVWATIYLTAVLVLGAGLPMVLLWLGWQGLTALADWNALPWLLDLLGWIAVAIDPCTST